MSKPLNVYSHSKLETLLGYEIKTMYTMCTFQKIYNVYTANPPDRGKYMLF